MRVLAHAHSNWSFDSKISLHEWADLAAERGCGAVLLAEHEEGGWNEGRYQAYLEACAAASRADIRLIPGLEFAQDGFHLLAYGLPSLPPRPGSLAHLAEHVRALGSRLCLAHPVKYDRYISLEMLAHLDAVEVWNAKWLYDGLIGPGPRALALAEGKLRLVGQDAHKVKHLTPLYLETETDDVPADLWAGRYRIALGERQWATSELPCDAWTALRHRWRYVAVRTALACYRLLGG